MSTENLRVRLTKQLIKEGLLRCLSEKPIDRISISELCKESGVNRATFYRHYQVPRDILMEIGWNCAEDVRALFMSEEGGAFEDKLTSCFFYLYENRNTLKTVFDADADKYLASSVTDIFHWYWDGFANLKEKAKLDTIEYDLTINALGWSAYHFVRQWIQEDIPKTPSEISDLILRLMNTLTIS